MTATPTTPVAIKLNTAMKERVKHLAEARHRTSHWLMREAINQYVEREEKREAFIQDAMRAWQEYETTGIHLTTDEVDNWLASLEQGEETDPPQSHS